MGEFKEGDKVAYDVSWSSEPIYTVSIIKRITPTGRIKLENGVEFTKQGFHKISDYRSYFLRKFDDHVIAAIERKGYIDHLKSVNWYGQKTETLKKVSEIIKNSV